jgi:MASE1
MSLSQAIRTIIIVALIRFIATEIDDKLLSAFDYNNYISFFYMPAGVTVLCMLIFGYFATIGLAIGSFMFLSLTTHNNIMIDALFCLTTPISAAIAYFTITYNKFGYTNLSTWSNYSLRDVFFFFAIYSLINAILHNIGITYILGFSPLSLQPIINKFIGNITGCLALYIGLSLIMWVVLLIQHNNKIKIRQNI